MYYTQVYFIILLYTIIINMLSNTFEKYCELEDKHRIYFVFTTKQKDDSCQKSSLQIKNISDKIVSS